MEHALPDTKQQVDLVALKTELAKYDPTAIDVHLRGDRSALEARIAAYAELCKALYARGEGEAAAMCRRQRHMLQQHSVPSIGFVEAPCLPLGNLAHTHAEADLLSARQDQLMGQKFHTQQHKLPGGGWVHALSLTAWTGVEERLGDRIKR